MEKSCGECIDFGVIKFGQWLLHVILEDLNVTFKIDIFIENSTLKEMLSFCKAIYDVIS